MRQDIMPRLKIRTREQRRDVRKQFVITEALDRRAREYACDNNCSLNSLVIYALDLFLTRENY